MENLSYFSIINNANKSIHILKCEDKYIYIYIYIYNISLGTTYLIFYWNFFAESMLKLYFEKKGEKIEVLKNYI